jgi:hypothetical protein
MQRGRAAGPNTRGCARSSSREIIGNNVLWMAARMRSPPTWRSSPTTNANSAGSKD